MTAVKTKAMRKILCPILLTVFISGGLTAKIEAQSFQLNTLAHFNNTNGASPSAGLTLAIDGAFYGTAYSGGSYSNGIVFKVTTNGTLTPLANFDSTNGANPNAGLTLGDDGFLYGSTYNGGTNLIAGGTLFRCDTNGILIPLTSFDGNFSSGSGKRPRAELATSTNGLFYGTTFQGGTGYGIIFKLSTNGNLTTLVNFGNTNGAFPSAGLTFGTDGLLYGVTSQGGTYNLGTAFRLTTNGTLSTLLMFDGTNGTKPNSTLILGNDGYFYGTTSGGGQYDLGTVFKMTTNGALTTLAVFQGTNGALPSSLFMSSNDGLFYGTTIQGGNTNLNGGLGFGTVFQMTTNGSLTTLINFDSTNGALPYGTLALGNDGNLYGTTSAGGIYDKGTIFQLSALPPPLNINLITDMVVLSWTNSAFSLQSAPEVTGTYTNISGSLSPYTSSIAGDQQYFRLIRNY